jgi:hypothetical protein
MSDYYVKPYLYDQPDDVVAKYEALAVEQIAQHSQGSHFDYVQNAFDLIHTVANEIWLSEIAYE